MRRLAKLINEISKVCSEQTGTGDVPSHRSCVDQQRRSPYHVGLHEMPFAAAMGSSKRIAISIEEIHKDPKSTGRF
jgi:hypothetical protein